MRIRLHQGPIIRRPDMRVLALDIDLIGEISCLLRPMINVIEADNCLSRRVSLSFSRSLRSHLLSSLFLSPFLHSLFPAVPLSLSSFFSLHSFLIIRSASSFPLPLSVTQRTGIGLYSVGGLHIQTSYKLLYSTHRKTISRKIQLSSMHSAHRIRQTPNQQETELA